MAKSVIEVLGEVVETLPNATFKVKLIDKSYPEHTVLAHLSGRMRVNYIKVVPGDVVTLELTPYDLTKGRLTFRHKSAEAAIAAMEEKHAEQAGATAEAPEADEEQSDTDETSSEEVEEKPTEESN